MSVNTVPSFLMEFNRAVENLRRKVEGGIEVLGDAAAAARTDNNSIVLRVTTTSDSKVRGGTLTFNWVESATPAGLSPTSGFDFTSI